MKNVFKKHKPPKVKSTGKPRYDLKANIWKARTPEARASMSRTHKENHYRKDPFFMVDGIEVIKVERPRMNTHCGVLTEKDLALMESYNE